MLDDPLLTVSTATTTAQPYRPDREVPLPLETNRPPNFQRGYRALPNTDRQAFRSAAVCRVESVVRRRCGRDVSDAAVFALTYPIMMKKESAGCRREVVLCTNMHNWPFWLRF